LVISPDHLGSTSYLTDANGEVYQHLEYLPFGETLVEEHYNSDRNPYLYNGKELDEETGLYYYGARYYDAQLGRWHVVDPKFESYKSLSPYNYVANNPLKFIDPEGEKIRYSWLNSKIFNKRMKAHINYMKKHGSSELRQLINNMESDKKLVRIRMVKSSKSIGFTGKTIFLYKNDKTYNDQLAMGEDGTLIKQDEFSTLANELSHGDDYIKGGKPSGTTLLQWNGMTEEVDNNEIKSIQIENLARDSKGMKRRSMGELAPYVSGLRDNATKVMDFINSNPKYSKKKVNETFPGAGVNETIRLWIKDQYKDFGTKGAKIIEKK